jgi:predicted acyltransferase
MSIASPPEPAAPRTVFASDVPPPHGVEPISKVEPQFVPEPIEPPKTERLPTTTSQRLVSLDAFRGLVMVLMVSAGLYIPKVVDNLHKAYPDRPTPVWDKVAFQTDHTQWVGCSLWDLIQPSFMFMVGAALMFSVGSRRTRGQSFWGMLVHAIIRSVVLVLLAVFFSSRGVGPRSHTNWLFTNVLAQIGLGYTFLFLLAWLRPRWQIAAAVAILVLYWGAFAAYPKPAADVSDAELARIKLPRAEWDRLHGFELHWAKSHNLAAAFDRWFLNRFHRADDKPFTDEEGGYQTLNFVPSLATMIFGLLAGGLLRCGGSPGAKFGILVATGVAGLAIGWALGLLGICPVVKRIWTPSWAIFSAGWALLALAAFYLVIDLLRLRAWSLPLVVVGMNSIAVYCISMTLKPWFREAVMKRHFGEHVFVTACAACPWLRDELLFLLFPQGAVQPYFGAHTYQVTGSVYAPMLEAGLFLLFCWLVAWWLYRQKAFLKI